MKQCGSYTFRPSGACYLLYQSGLYTFRLSEAMENHISAPAVKKEVVEEAQSRMNVLRGSITFLATKKHNLTECLLLVKVLNV